MGRDAGTDEGAQLASRAALANHLELSASLVRERIARGIWPKSGTLEQYRSAELKYLRGRAAGHLSEDGLDLTAERARLAKEQADKLARENALARGEVVYASEIETWLTSLFSALMQRIRALAAKVAPEAHGSETIAECEAIIRRHVDEALEEIAQAKWIGPDVPESAPTAVDADRAGGVSSA